MSSNASLTFAQARAVLHLPCDERETSRPCAACGILHIPSTACGPSQSAVCHPLTLAIVKQAYKKRAKETHPDRNSHVDSDKAKSAFQVVGEAYEVLLRRLGPSPSSGEQTAVDSCSDSDDDLDPSRQYSAAPQSKLPGDRSLSDKMRERIADWEQEFVMKHVPSHAVRSVEKFNQNVRMAWDSLMAESDMLQKPFFGPSSGCFACDECGKEFASAALLSTHKASTHDPLDKFLATRGTFIGDFAPLDLIARPQPFGWGGQIVDPVKQLEKDLTPALRQLLQFLAEWDITDVPPEAADNSHGIQPLLMAVSHAMEEAVTEAQIPELPLILSARKIDAAAWQAWSKAGEANAAKGPLNAIHELNWVPLLSEASLDATPNGNGLPLPLPVLQVRKAPAWARQLRCMRCAEWWCWLHHCRMCGFTVCSKCSPSSLRLPEYGYSSPERVCVKCRVECRRERVQAWVDSLCSQEASVEAVDVVAALCPDLGPDDWYRAAVSAANPAIQLLCGVRAGRSPEQHCTAFLTLCNDLRWHDLGHVLRSAAQFISDDSWLGLATQLDKLAVSARVRAMCMLLVFCPTLRAWKETNLHSFACAPSQVAATWLSIRHVGATHLGLWTDTLDAASEPLELCHEFDFAAMALLVCSSNLPGCPPHEDSSQPSSAVPKHLVDKCGALGLIAARESNLRMQDWFDVAATVLPDPRPALAHLAAALGDSSPTAAVWLLCRELQEGPVPSAGEQPPAHCGGSSALLERCMALVEAGCPVCAKALLLRVNVKTFAPTPACPLPSPDDPPKMLLHNLLSVLDYAPEQWWPMLALAFLDVNQVGPSLACISHAEKEARQEWFTLVRARDIPPPSLAAVVLFQLAIGECSVAQCQQRIAALASKSNLHPLALDLAVQAIRPAASDPPDTSAMALLARALAATDQPELALNAFAQLERRGVFISAEDQRLLTSLRLKVQTQEREPTADNRFIQQFRDRQLKRVAEEISGCSSPDAFRLDAFVRFVSDPSLVATGTGHDQATAIKNLATGVHAILSTTGATTCYPDTVKFSLAAAVDGGLPWDAGRVLALHFRGPLPLLPFEQLAAKPQVGEASEQSTARLRRLPRGIRVFFKAESQGVSRDRPPLENAFLLMDLGSGVSIPNAACTFLLRSAHECLDAMTDQFIPSNYATRRLLGELCCIAIELSSHSAPGFRAHVSKHAVQLLIEANRRWPCYLEPADFDRNIKLVHFGMAHFAQASTALGSSLWHDDLMPAKDVVFENLSEAQSFALVSRLELLLTEMQHEEHTHRTHQSQRRMFNEAEHCAYLMHHGRYHGWLQLPNDHENAVAAAAAQAPREGSIGERLDMAAAAKRRGNEALEKMAVLAARRHYSFALGCLDLQDTYSTPSMDEAAQLREMRLELHLNLALVHLRLGNWSEAREAAEQALSLDPRSTKALYRRGIATYQLGKRAQAVDDLARAFERSSNDTEVFTKLQEARAGVPNLARAHFTAGGDSWPLQFRLLCMEMMLQNAQHSWEAVERNLVWPMAPSSEDGFVASSSSPLSQEGGAALPFVAVQGFSVNIQQGTATLNATLAGEESGLLCERDIADVIGHGIDQAVFSLEAIDDRDAHPFQAMQFLPSQLAPDGEPTLLLRTMFRTDFLLKMFSTNVEVSALPPFHIRPAAQGLLQRLPADLRRELVRLHCEPRGSSRGQAHRFWIEAGELEYSKTGADDGSVTFVFGRLPMVVKTHRLVIDSATGRHRDADEEQDLNSWEERVAALLTERYNELAEAFPEFARLRELSKLQVVYRLVKGMVLGHRSFLEDDACLDELSTAVAAMAADLHAKAEVQVREVAADVQSNIGRIRQGKAQIHNQQAEILGNIEAERIKVGRGRYANEYEVLAHLNQQEQSVRQQCREACADLDAKLSDMLDRFQLGGRSPLPDEVFNAVQRNVIREHAKVLASEHGVDQSDCHAALKHVIQSDDHSRLCALLAPAIRARNRKELEEGVTALCSNGFANFVEEDDLSLSQGDIECCWVPAAFRIDAQTRVHGGVNLTARLRESSLGLQRPPTSSVHLSGTTLNTQRAANMSSRAAASIDSAARQAKASTPNQAAFSATTTRVQLQQQLGGGGSNGGHGGGGGGNGGHRGGDGGSGGWFHLLQKANPVSPKVVSCSSANRGLTTWSKVGNVTIKDYSKGAPDTYHRAAAVMMRPVLQHGTEALHKRKEPGHPNGGYTEINLPGEVNEAKGTFEVGIDTDKGQVVHALFRKDVGSS